MEVIQKSRRPTQRAAWGGAETPPPPGSSTATAAINGHGSAESHNTLRPPEHQETSDRLLLHMILCWRRGDGSWLCWSTHTTHRRMCVQEQKHEDTATPETLINTKTGSIALNVRLSYEYTITWLFSHDCFLFFFFPSKQPSGWKWIRDRKTYKYSKKKKKTPHHFHCFS